MFSFFFFFNKNILYHCYVFYMITGNLTISCSTYEGQFEVKCVGLMRN